MRTAEPKSPGVSSKKSGPFFSHGKGAVADAPTKQHFFPKRSFPIQAKLSIGQPGDRYEREADAVADSVVQKLAESSRIQRTASPGGVTQFIQTKCATCGHEESLQRKEEDEPVDFVQRKCSTCELEERLQKQEAGSQSQHSSHTIEGRLQDSKGNGFPIPTDSKIQLEQSFNTDFSSVRLHTDSNAIQMNKDLRAQAFTNGSDIYFNEGKLNLSQGAGQHLMAHELTHVVQQGAGGNTVQRDGLDTQATFKQPHEIVLDYYNSLLEIEDPDAKAKNKRELFLLEAKLAEDEGIGDVQDSKSSEDYASFILEEISKTSESEDATIQSLITSKALPVTLDKFLEHPFFASIAGAFPDKLARRVLPPIKPPDDLGAELQSDEKRTKDYYDSIKELLPIYLFEDGLPVSYTRSQTLTHYELIKPQNFSNAKVFIEFSKHRPSMSSDLDFLIEPEEKDLHKSTFLQYQDAWSSYVVKKYAADVYSEWMAKYNLLSSNIKHGNLEGVNVPLLNAFERQYASGMSLDDFYGQGSSNLLVDLTQIGVMMSTSWDPASYMTLARMAAVSSASTHASEFISREMVRFQREYLLLADKKIEAQTPNERLWRCTRWALTQGFASESIEMLINNFESLAWDMAKEMGKQSLLKRAISFVVSLHPLGRLLSIAYTIYDTIDDASDAIDVATAIAQVAMIVDAARSATSVVDTQRSSAQLTYATSQLIPIIIQKLSVSMAQKLMHGVGKKKAPDTDAKQKAHERHTDPKHLLDESSHIDSVHNLDYAHLHNELETVKSGSVKKSSDADFDIEVDAKNHHTWRRDFEGTWCRFTKGSCINYGEVNPDVRQELKQMNNAVDEKLPKDSMRAPEGVEDIDTNISLDKLRAKAKSDPRYAEALLFRYRNNMGLKKLKDKYHTDETAKALLDEYYDKPTDGLTKLEAQGDRLAKQVLDDLYGEADRNSGKRVNRENVSSDPVEKRRLDQELKDMRRESKIERRDLRRELAKGKLEGGTMGVGSTDIPGLANVHFKGASVYAKGTTDKTYQPPSTDTRALGHAEQNLAGEVNAHIKQAIASGKLKPSELDGKTVRFHIEEDVCQVCRQAINPGSEKLSGVLKQLSTDYPNLTIEITASGTSEVIIIKGGTARF